MTHMTVIIDTTQELNHAFYMQTGLYELEHEGVIAVKTRLSVAGRKGCYVVDNNGQVQVTSQPFPKTSFYTLKDHKTGKRIKFAADLYDHAEQFSKTALETCDFYFKRNYESHYISKLSKDYQEKIHPLGLTFRVMSVHQKMKEVLFWGLMLSNLNVNLKFDRLFFKRLLKTYRAQINHWKFISTTRLLNRFETFQKSTSETIFFQTRCFQHENQEDVKQIHHQRYHIIKLLQQAFPEQFQGGFIPSPLAHHYYADALSNVPSEPEQYLEALKQAKVVIYTRGLARSPAWKMAEYLSQGKVIIAEPLTAELPEPLIHGIHLLYFNSDEELVKNIETVLRDEVLCDTLSKNARIYFETQVHPAKNLKRILDLMLFKSLS